MELEGVGEHRRVSLGSGELVSIGERIWILYDPAQSAAQREVLSLEVPLAMGKKEERRKKVPKRSS